MLDLFHLVVDVGVLPQLVQLLLLGVQRPQVVLGVVARLGQLVRHLVQRRLKLRQVVLQLTDARDLVGHDRRRRRVTRDADRRVRRRDLELVVGPGLLVDGRLQRRDLLLPLPDLCLVL